MKIRLVAPALLLIAAAAGFAGCNEPAYLESQIKEIQGNIDDVRDRFTADLPDAADRQIEMKGDDGNTYQADLVVELNKIDGALEGLLMNLTVDLDATRAGMEAAVGKLNGILDKAYYLALDKGMLIDTQQFPYPGGWSSTWWMISS